MKKAEAQNSLVSIKVFVERCAAPETPKGASHIMVSSDRPIRSFLTTIQIGGEYLLEGSFLFNGYLGFIISIMCYSNKSVNKLKCYLRNTHKT